jgi:hypothetical protein
MPKSPIDTSKPKDRENVNGAEMPAAPRARKVPILTDVQEVVICRVATRKVETRIERLLYYEEGGRRVAYRGP